MGNDWTSVNSKKKCNDVLLSFVSYSICIDDGSIIYFVKSEENEMTHGNDALKAFYRKTNGLITSELSHIKLNVMDDKDWSEIYQIHGNQERESIKLCNYVSMIKICAEGTRKGNVFE